MKRRNFLPLAALPLVSSFSWAQKYPSSASTIIMPLQAGSASDVAIRHMAERLTQKLGQGFAVENVAAAAGLVGLDRLSKARTDGLVVAALNNSIMTILPHLQAKNMKVDRQILFYVLTRFPNALYLPLVFPPSSLDAVI